MTSESILVLGHRNPDTDAIASAIGYAWFLNQQGDATYEAGKLGGLNPQTTFVLSRFGVTEPKLVEHVHGKPAQKVVLVDHNEVLQAVPGLEEAEIVEILDHHRLNTVAIPVPIRIQIEPVGCTATLITERMLNNGLVPPVEIAGILLSAIISDTLIFKSPTTTPRDQTAGLQLAKWAQLAPETASDDEVFQAISTWGDEVLAAGASLSARPADEIVSSDTKFYEVGPNKVGITQVEITDLNELEDFEMALRKALEHFSAREGLSLGLLLVTDVKIGTSKLIAVGNQAIINALPYKQMNKHLLDAPNIVSRKKQLLPTVLEVLEKFV